MKSVSLNAFNAFDEIHASIPMKFYITTTKLEFREFAIDSNTYHDDFKILALCHIPEISDG